MPRTRQRRNKGEGSITKTPNGKYKATITIGVGIDGKQKRKSVTRDTKREVIDAITELRHKYNIGDVSKGVSKTIKDVCDFRHQGTETHCVLFRVLQNAHQGI